jgi:hypothetical protein
LSQPQITQRPDGSRLVNGRWLRPSWTCTWDELVRLHVTPEHQLTLDPPVTPRAKQLKRYRQNVLMGITNAPDFWLLTQATENGDHLELQAIPDQARSESERYRPIVVRYAPESLVLSALGMIGRDHVSAELRCMYDAGQVQLFVSDRAPREDNPVVLDLRAATLADLIAQHPAECHRYLLPLVRGFGDRHLLEPGAADVYRAFAGIRADPEVTKKALAAVDAMTDADPSVREAADAALDSLGRAGVLAMLRLDHSRLQQFSPEQRDRVSSFLARNSTRKSDPSELAHDAWFALECLTDSDTRIRSAAKSVIEGALGQEPKFDVHADAVTQQTQIDAIEEQLLQATSSAP